MTLPASGSSISMSQINTELGRSSTATVSLDTAENGGYGAINTCGSPFPLGANAASMSEWFSYNHSAACGNSSFAFSDGGVSTAQNMLYNDILNYGTRVSTTQPNSRNKFTFSFWLNIVNNSVQGYLFGLKSPTSGAFLILQWGSFEDPNDPGVYANIITFTFFNPTGSGYASGKVNLSEPFTNNPSISGVDYNTPWGTGNRGNVGTNKYSLITIVYDFSQFSSNQGDFIKFYWNEERLQVPFLTSGTFQQSYMYGDSILAPNWTNAEIYVGGSVPSELSSGCQLDNFALFTDSALTEQQISNIYNFGSDVATTATYTGIGNVLLYRFEQDGTDLGVDSGNFIMNLDNFNNPLRVADPAP